MRNRKADFISLFEAWVCHARFEQGHADREREQDFGSHEHRYHAEIRQSDHRKDRQGFDGARQSTQPVVQQYLNNGVTMKRTIISISENGTVNIPSAEIWMSEMELVDLFGVISPTLRAAIKAIYRNGGFCPSSTQRYRAVTPTIWAIFYNLEVIVALAFRLNTYEANMIRQRVLKSVYQRKKKNINLLISFGRLQSQSSVKS